MKYLIVCLAIGIVAAERLDNRYIPPPTARQQQAGGFNVQPPTKNYLPPGQSSNQRNSFAPAPQAYNQQQSFSAQSVQPLNQGSQGSFTNVQKSNGFNSVSTGAFSAQGAPRPNFQQSNGGGYQQSNGYQSSNANQGYNGNAQQSSFAQNSYSQQQSGPTTPPIPILSYNNVPHTGDGSYSWDYATGNGIMAQEKGYLNNAGSENPEQVAVGSYSYTAPDGQLISITYKADSNGFVPEGDHIPKLSPEYYEAVRLFEEKAAELAKLQAEQSQAGQSQGGQQSYNYQASNQVSQQRPSNNYNGNNGNNGNNYNQAPAKNYLPPNQAPQQSYSDTQGYRY